MSEHQSSNSEQDSKNPTPSLTGDIIPDEANNGANGYQKYYQKFKQSIHRFFPDEQTTFNRLLLIFNAFIVAGTLFMAKYTSSQADSSAKAVEIAVTNSHVENRAYVLIKGLDPPIFKPGEAIGVPTHIINSGRTPAEHVGSYTVVGWCPTSSKAITLPNVDPHNGVIIGSEDTSNAIRYSIDKISKDGIDSIMNNQIMLYVAGMIVYTDLYKGMDTTAFCGTFVPSAGRFMYSDYFNYIR